MNQQIGYSLIVFIMFVLLVAFTKDTELVDMMFVSFGFFMGSMGTWRKKA